MLVEAAEDGKFDLSKAIVEGDEEEDEDDVDKTPGGGGENQEELLGTPGDS